MQGVVTPRARLGACAPRWGRRWDPCGGRRLERLPTTVLNAPCPSLSRPPFPAPSVAYPKRHSQDDISDIYLLPHHTRCVFVNVALQARATA